MTESRSVRLEIAVRQTKSLLSDFKKAKMKCLELSDRLGRELDNLQQYEILGINCTRKLQTLDIAGVMQLKNQLVKSIAQLCQSERELLYQLEKNSFKKAVKTPLIMSREGTGIFAAQELGQFEVPNYQSRNEPNDSKVQRIANFILSLGKSMGALRRSILGEWQEQQFYKYEPQYLQILRKLQQFKMREEQMSHIIERRFEQQMHKIIAQGEKVQERGDHFVVKISKKAYQNFGKQEQEPKRHKDRSFDELDTSYHPISMIEPKRKVISSKKIPLQKINEEKGDPQKFQMVKHASDNTLDLHSMSAFQRYNNNNNNSRMSRFENSSQLEESGQNGNYIYMVRAISPDNQLNSSIISSISSLRSMRKKVFDDDIWDQFQKI